MRGFLFILLTALQFSGISDLDKVLEKTATNMVSADYSCTIMVEGTRIILNGSVTAQGKCFKLIGNGFEIWCDGTTLLYTDPKAREAYMEPASKLTNYISGHAGDLSDLNLSNVRYSPFQDETDAFKLPMESFGSDWIITDLRQ